jgi:predicted metal-dependent peptidase
MYSGIFLPTLDKDETIDIETTIDMSGSSSEETGRDFISEVYGIMNQYHDFNIGLSTFDTRVYNRQKFTKDTQEELLGYKLMGGGGTNFSCFWEYYIKHNIKPKLLVVFTDGFNYSNDWGPSDYCPTLWVITDGGRTKVLPPWGKWCYYSDDGVDEVGEV